MGAIGFHRSDDGIPINAVDGLREKPGVFRGIVVNVAWSQLQPSADMLITAPIDQALDQIRRYNLTFPDTPLAVDLRVWAGPNAPPWAKSLGGAPIEIRRIYLRQPLQTITVGRFWGDEYAKAWISLQVLLADKYDAEPLIREVSDTSCSAYTDEPFVIAADPVSLQNMHDAGFSDAAFKACLVRSVHDYAAWRTTRIQFAVNPFRRTDTGRPVLAPEETSQILKQVREEFGQRVVLSNHAFREPQHPWIAPIIEQIKQLGPPITFQTESPKAPEGLDWERTIQSAIDDGADAIEVWSGREVDGFETIPIEDLSRWALKLKDKRAQR